MPVLISFKYASFFSHGNYLHGRTIIFIRSILSPAGSNKHFYPMIESYKSLEVIFR